MEVVKMYVEESTKNKEMFVLVVETKSGEKFVVSGDANFPTYLKPYETCFYTNH